MYKMYRRLFVAQRILLTLGYTEQFQFPLTICELYLRLLSSSRVKKRDFVLALQFLVSKKKIEYVSGFLIISGLPSKESNALVNTRIKRRAYSEKKWTDIYEFISFAKNIPFITGVAITGSVAVQNATKDDDIDFMIVTKPNRLWLVRLLVIAYASLRGKRRSFAQEEKNSWCFNLWIEESDLQLPPQSRSVYEAYEVLQAQWVLSRGKVAQQFWLLNRWTNKLIVGSQLWQQVMARKSESLGGFELRQSIFSFYEIPIISEVILILLFISNFCAYQLQYVYMKQHMTREKVSRTHAFFHPRDTKSAIFLNWKQTVKRL